MRRRPLQALEQLLTPDKRDRILDAAAVLVVDAVEPGNPQHDVASSLLEGTVVPAGEGVTALSHLERHFHTQAGVAYGGDIDRWVRELVDRRVLVYADRAGPAAAAVRARTAAVERYRSALTTDTGRVDLTMLAEDLQPLVVDDLAEQLRVTVPGNDKDPVSLMAVARRRTRLLVNGLPGAGKSAAMRQLAARWASTPAAPLPVLVRLQDLVPACSAPSDVTLDRLCETAAALAPADEQPALVEAMLGCLRRGEAVLLLDGLDECVERRAVVAEGLKHILAELPDETGVVMTTRPSGVTAAGRLPLDEVFLTTPAGLDGVLEQLLRHVADVRVPEADRPGWVRDRTRRVYDITRAHEDMGSVPLLAVLITLVIADSPGTPTPEDTAAVLHRAVQQTAGRWERHRAQLPGAWPGPSEKQLLEGFAAIGHLLSERAAVTVTDVETAVSAVMTTRWGLAAGPAGGVTEAIRRFWDDQVGVFVAGHDDRVVARSRVFAEIGAAMHSPTLPSADLTHWVAVAVADDDRHNALLLAAQLDDRIIDELLEPGGDADVRTRLATTALRGSAGQRIDRAGRLLDRLTEAATRVTPPDPGPAPDPAMQPPTSGGRPSTAQLVERMAERRLRRDGPVWPWAADIAELALPAALDHRRAEILAALPLSEDQHHVARGIAALASADASGRALTPDERVDVLGMLAVPLPPQSEIRRPSRGRLVLGASVGLLDGLGQATARAAARLPELGDEAVEHITAIAPRAGWRSAVQIRAAMREHGHVLELVGFDPNTWARIAQTSDDVRAVQRMLLAAVAELSTADVGLTGAERWRLPVLCDFLVVLGVDDVSVPDFRAVLHDPVPVQKGWLRLMALGAGVDLARLSAEARAARDETAAAGDVREPVAFALASVWPTDAGRSLDPGRLTAEDHRLAVGLLAAVSGWIAESAAELLWEAADVPGLAEQVADVLTRELPVERRVLVAVLSCVLSPDPAASAARFFDDSDPALHRAAATLSSGAGDDRQLEALRARALRHEDATVRVAAGAASLREPGQPAPTYWSCPGCGLRNDPAEEACQACDWGRPAPTGD